MMDLELTEFTELDSENIHKLESWKNRYRLRRAEKKFVFLLTQKTLREEILNMQKMIEQLQSQTKLKHISRRNEGDEVYDMHRDMLENKHMNEIVAIDVENQKIVGYGNTVEKAYFDAKMTEPEKSQFYFRKVGSPYVERL